MIKNNIFQCGFGHIHLCSRSVSLYIFSLRGSRSKLPPLCGWFANVGSIFYHIIAKRSTAYLHIYVHFPWIQLYEPLVLLQNASELHLCSSKTHSLTSEQIHYKKINKNKIIVPKKYTYICIEAPTTKKNWVGLLYLLFSIWLK